MAEARLAPKMLVRDAKNQCIKWLRKQNTDLRKQRKKTALTTKSIPITKTLKIEKKIRSQNNKIQNAAISSTNYTFLGVKKKHKQMEESFLLACEDKYPLRPVYSVYFANFANWEQHFCKLNDNAVFVDNQKALIEDEKQEFFRNIEHKKAHFHTFLPSLTLLASSSSASSSSSSGSFGNISFSKKPKTCGQILERLYASFYFETVVSAEKLITVFPEIPTVLDSGPKECPKNAFSYFCENCDAELIVEEMLGQVTCPVCSIVKQGGEGVGYKQSFIEAQSSNRAPTPYDRRHHLREFIQRLEGAERTEIPEAVIRSILQKCRMVKINPVAHPEKVTYRFVRISLRESGYAEFFENITQIISIVTRKQPVMFQEDQKERLYMIFQEIQAPFDKNKGSRKNFLSYSYVLFKSCELLGYTSFLPYLPLFKAPKNLQSADTIWEKICADLNYQFIPTQI